MPVYSQASRDYRFIPGSGGRINIYQWSDLFVAGGQSIVDVAEWVIQRIFRNAETPHSGSGGAMLRTRTGHDWNAAVRLQFPAQLVGGELTATFVEQLIGSANYVGMVFNIGAPEFWTSRNLPIRTYRAERALLEGARIVNNNEGGEVVTIDVTMQGSSLLVLYLNEIPQNETLWF